jgi:O-acetylhomoserine/O-acetylserine sulfhydrylase-like pyridoxal-dependent enzyme
MSTTSAGPTSASSATASIVVPSSTKWIGGST